MKQSKRWLVAAALGASSVAGLAGFGINSAQAAKAPACTTSGQVDGGGATFQADAQAVFIADYNTLCGPFGAPSPTYAAVGSGAGRTGFCNGTYDYAGTDQTFTAAAKATCETGKSTLLHIPVAMGAVTVSYNVPNTCSTGQLSLTSAQISGIFDGTTITNWSSVVPGCNVAITRVVRSDSSGTTSIFKDYMAQRNAGPGWNTLANTAWPAGTTLVTGAGNNGVADGIIANDGSFGYVDLADAKDKALTWAKAENSTGLFEDAAKADGSANCDGATRGTPMPAVEGNWEGFSVTDSRAGYPICGFTYMIAWSNGNAAGLTDGQEQTVADLVTLSCQASTQVELSLEGYGQLTAEARARCKSALLQFS